MANIGTKRIVKELQEFINPEETTQWGVKLELIGDDFNELIGEISGPPDTPYEGGKFKLKIKIPSRYPFEPPNVRFITKVWHPNISSETGYICLDTLKHKWSSSLSLRSVLLSIQVLLANPKPDDPQDGLVAKQLKNYPKAFELTALHWTNIFAGGPNKIENFGSKINKIIKSAEEEELSEVLSDRDRNSKIAMFIFLILLVYYFFF